MGFPRNEQAILTNASFPLNLKDENGGEVNLTFKAPTDAQLAEIDEWLRARTLKIAYASLNGITDARQREEILGVAMRQAQHISWLSADGRKSLATIEGMAKVAEYATGNQIEFPRLCKLLSDPENLLRVSEAIRYATGNVEDAPDASAKKKARAKRKKRLQK